MCLGITNNNANDREAISSRLFFFANAPQYNTSGWKVPLSKNPDDKHRCSHILSNPRCARYNSDPVRVAEDNEARSVFPGLPLLQVGNPKEK